MSKKKQPVKRSCNGLQSYAQKKEQELAEAKRNSMWARHAQVFEYLYNQEKNNIEALISRG